MEKIKKFVKENKEIVITSIISAGLAVGCKALYDIGVDKGKEIATIAWLAMLNADTDETLMLRDHILSKAKLDNNGNFIKYGHEMLKGVKEGVGL